MEKLKQGFFLLLTLIVAVKADDDVRNFCRFRVGIYPHPNPELCTKYVQCRIFSFEVRDCNEGLIFVSGDGCVPGNSLTCEREESTIIPPTEQPTVPPTEIPTIPPTLPPTIPPTQPPTIPPTIPTPTIPPGNVCENINVGLIPDPNNCAGYILCVFFTPEFMNCPANQVFDPVRLGCFPGNTETCEIFDLNTTEPTTIQTTTEVETTTRDYSEEINQFCRLRTGTFPHPNPAFCNLFIQCQLIRGIVQECEAGRIFVQDQGCVPGNSETCERDALPPFLPNTNNICEGIILDFLPNPESCASYIVCVFEEPRFINCEPNHIWDITLRQCVPGDPESCEVFPETPAPTIPPTDPPTEPPTEVPTIPPTIPPTEVPTVPPTEPPTEVPTEAPTEIPTIPPTNPPLPAPEPTTTVSPPREICQGNNGRFIADPSSCYRFFYCLLGTPIPGVCAEDRIFVTTLGFGGCVLGNQETCERDENIITITVVPTRRPN